MVCLASVYGQWLMIKGRSWQFEVDKGKGGRMLNLRDGCTHEELVRMVQADYMLDMEAELVEISYPLPDVMLQQMPSDFPPMYVTNDGQVDSLIELGKTHVLRLCISLRNKNKVEKRDEDRYVDEDEEEEDEELSDINWDANSDEEVEEEDDDLGDDDYVDGDFAGKEADHTDADYSAYGKLQDDDDWEIKCFEKRLRRGDFNGVGGGINGNGSGDIYVNQSYVNKDALISALRLKAVVSRFAFKVSKSNTKLFVAKCFVDGCKWMCRAAIKNEAKRFWVTKYVKVHTCSVVERAEFRKGCTPRYLGQIFVERFGTIDGIVPRHIEISMRVMLGLKLNYTTSYRALKFAQLYVRGTPEAGYAALPSYLRRVKQSNPGSVADLVCDEMGRFKYCFLSLSASMLGFQYLRRVIVVDGTHLTGKYGGVLLVAAGQDANFQVFPLAFGIVDAENNESWGWFFDKLQLCFSDHPMVIVSDRHPSIDNACLRVLPSVTRGICYYHLQHNIVTKYQAKDIMYLVKGAAYAYTLMEFNRCMAAIRAAKPDLAKYLEEADPKLWSRVHFPGDRYNIKTSNIAESINSALKRAKGFPIPCLLQFIREKLGVWFNKRREDALSLHTPYSKGVEYLLSVRSHYAASYNVEHIDGWKFNVLCGGGPYIVDLENRSCECGVFLVEKIPCSHVIAAATEANIHMSQNVATTYTKEALYATYAHPIYPEATHDEEPHEDICLPPEVKPNPGRKKKSRFLTWLELSKKRRPKPRKMHKVYSCSKCRQPGHTRPHCVSTYNSFCVPGFCFMITGEEILIHVIACTDLGDQRRDRLNMRSTTQP